MSTNNHTINESQHQDNNANAAPGAPDEDVNKKRLNRERGVSLLVVLILLLRNGTSSRPFGKLGG